MQNHVCNESSVFRGKLCPPAVNWVDKHAYPNSNQLIIGNTLRDSIMKHKFGQNLK